jgi:mono/diheme cytochrome c family protein
MTKKSLACLSFLAALPLSAGATPFAKGDPAKGQALYEKNCQGCHESMFGGDGSKIFTRSDRKIHSASGLAQQIAGCNSQLSTMLFPEDEADIGAYLNKAYYKFK